MTSTTSSTSKDADLLLLKKMVEFFSVNNSFGILDESQKNLLNQGNLLTPKNGTDEAKPKLSLPTRLTKRIASERIKRELEDKDTDEDEPAEKKRPTPITTPTHMVYVNDQRTETPTVSTWFPPLEDSEDTKPSPLNTATVVISKNPQADRQLQKLVNPKPNVPSSSATVSSAPLSTVTFTRAPTIVKPKESPVKQIEDKWYHLAKTVEHLCREVDAIDQKKSSLMYTALIQTILHFRADAPAVQ